MVFLEIKVEQKGKIGFIDKNKVNHCESIKKYKLFHSCMHIQPQQRFHPKLFLENQEKLVLKLF